MSDQVHPSPSGPAAGGEAQYRQTRAGHPSSPLGRLGRRLRRPFHRATALYRRSIQLRVVAATMLLSVALVVVLGFVVMAQVRTGLLDTKKRAAENQASGGFTTAQQQSDALAQQRSKAGSSTDPNATSPTEPGTWLSEQVASLASGGQGVYSVIGLVPSPDPGAPPLVIRASGDVNYASISQDLQAQVAADDSVAHEQTTTIHRGTGGQTHTEPGLVIGKQLTGPDKTKYQLYFAFSFAQEDNAMSLVTGTVATAGVFIVVLVGCTAWLVVRQVVTPVRMAAGIAERLADGHLEERMKVTGTDDIARLGESFNRMADALQAQIRQLEELSRVQRRFVSDVSHELRTPLTTVRMAADLIYDSREDLDPMAARSAELLQGQLDRFESLLADLLEISRFDAGAAVLDAEPVDLRDIVHRVVESADPLARLKGSAVLLRGADEPVVAEVDPRRIERILRNLVVNALEHGEGRDVVIRLGSADGAVAVGVRDYGIGLKPGEASRVFHRFWRADPSRVRTTGGTGLGLSIAVEDAHLHGGWLQAWGEPGGGSHFRLTLPRTRGGEIGRAPFRLEPEDSRYNRGLRAQGTPYRRALPAGATALTASGEPTVIPETPGGVGGGLGPGLGGVLSIGGGLGPRRLPQAPVVADPSDVSSASGGYGATGAQVVVDPARLRSPEGEGSAPDGSAATERPSDERAVDEQAVDDQAGQGDRTSAKGARGGEQRQD
ncbi:MtrAB system histidine kinase MtrB [Kitasatospora sp. LaBMicrA B282]|uniref:MtrAB system histidine kinase MtrB n=1 Tax=Kitasatospora sp. LaBMicrA B282 TaxID=3420949 RepID=UPI003D1483D2